MKNLFCFLIFCFNLNVFSNYNEKFEDKILSPYFFIESDDPELDQLPLKSTEISVKIAGIIADVKIKQVYKNEGKRPIEAIYVFPLSTRAAVHSMKMKIGERTIVAKVKEKSEAREIYNRAKKEGRTASLLEQKRPNVFQMNVANIMPSDLIEVELSYTEILTLEEKIYEFVFPTVVGPRYSNVKESEAPEDEKWIKSPYTFENELPKNTFNINVLISAGIPIQEVFCPSHNVNVNFLSPDRVKIDLDESEKFGGNKDFILKYKLFGKKIEDGILLYENKGEKYFLLMAQPPERVSNSEFPEREYIFIVDVSGSMYGFPIEISKKVIKGILKNLKPSDKFNILLFSGSSYIFSPKSLPANSENITKAIELIDKQKGGGGTELVPALKKALMLPRDENLSTTIVVLTDGYVTVEREVFELIRNNLDKANLFAFGIGTSVNRFLIEGMARAGMAESFILTKPEEAEKAVKKFKEVVSYPILTDIKIEFNGFDVKDVEPKKVPDLFLQKPIILFGKYNGKPSGVIEIKGLNGNGLYKEKINVYEKSPLKENSALPYLWARHKIAMLSDYETLEGNEKNKNEIISLGLKYNLLTQYTSFIAEDTIVRNKGGKIQTVNQPLPLPEGVSNYAVGAELCKTSGLPDFVANEPATRAEEKKEVDKFEQKETLIRKTNVKILSIKSSNEKLEKDLKEKITKFLNSINLCNKEGKVGNLSVKIQIDLNGNVENIKILKSNLNKITESCIINNMKKWNFSEIKISNSFEVELTIGFYA